MTTFPVHSSETAPEGSKPILAAAQKKFGFVPNLYRVMAEAPASASSDIRIHIFADIVYACIQKQPHQSRHLLCTGVNRLQINWFELPIRQNLNERIMAQRIRAQYRGDFRNALMLSRGTLDTAIIVDA